MVRLAMRHEKISSGYPTPIRYTYVKSESFAKEREMRIALSALGMGHCVSAEGTKIEFPPSLQLDFDFKQAIAQGAIHEIFPGPGCDTLPSPFMTALPMASGSLS
jgi:hypothetical protein